MASLKKFNGTTWDNAKVRKLTTATDTITTLPADIYANGNNATIGISGNTVQSGTPAPDNPIMPEGTGERTANLINVYANDTSNGYVNNALMLNDGSLYTPSSAYVCEYQPINEGVTYTLNTGGKTGNAQSICFYTSDKRFISGIAYENRTIITFTTPQGARYFRCTVMRFQTDTESYKRTMLNTGSTALPYEPYGYKLDISSANTATPVYLGEVPTTRKIKKLVLTGVENITSGHIEISLFNISVSNYLKERIITIVCSHYNPQENVVEWTLVRDKRTAFHTGAASTLLYIRDSSYSTIADFKAYLAAQYAAGTPVTVWYALAETTTGVVNEPLMKIGDYADEVSGITIPTTTGGDTLSVDTTVQPSEVSLSYTGWHDATVKEWDGGQWNE